MKPFILEAKHMISVKETAFQKDTATRLARYLIKQPKAALDAMESPFQRPVLVPIQANRDAS